LREEGIMGMGFYRCAIVLLLSLLAASVSRAQELRIDLSTFVSVSAGNWNNINNLNGVTPGLIDFNTGLPTTASISGTGWTDFFGVDSNAEWPTVDWVVTSSVRDGAGILNSQTGVFNISGLTAPFYTVEVVSARTTFNYLNNITVNGSLANRTFDGTPVVTPWGSNADGLLPQNWLIWDNVVPAGGTINVTDVASPNTLGIVNAIRITAIPEPASAGLLVAAGICLARRRARSI
jgi:hypothetical protein